MPPGLQQCSRRDCRRSSHCCQWNRNSVCQIFLFFSPKKSWKSGFLKEISYHLYKWWQWFEYLFLNTLQAQQNLCVGYTCKPSSHIYNLLCGIISTEGNVLKAVTSEFRGGSTRLRGSLNCKIRQSQVRTQALLFTAMGP